MTNISFYYIIKVLTKNNGDFNQKDYEISCVHEAGHVLSTCLSQKLPIGLSSRVIKEYDVEGGITNFDFHEAYEKTLACNKWLMYCALAGHIAEEVIYGKTYTGCSHDLEVWHKTSRRYFRNQTDKVFFFDPDNKMEIESNKILMQNMMEQQKDTLRMFFEENIETLESIAGKLKAKGKITLSDIKHEIKETHHNFHN